MNESYSQIASSIRTYIEDNWDDNNASIVWENTPQNLTGSDPWVRISVKFYRPNNNTIGADCIHRRGFLQAQIFTRYDVGTGSAELVADEIRTLIEFQRLNTIMFYGAVPDHIGDSVRQLNHIEASWFQLVLNIPFETA